MVCAVLSRCNCNRAGNWHIHFGHFHNLCFFLLFISFFITSICRIDYFYSLPSHSFSSWIRKISIISSILLIKLFLFGLHIHEREGTSWTWTLKFVVARVVFDFSLLYSLVLVEYRFLLADPLVTKLLIT